jgi:LmbE family N-acetylglucosaminyl deacetylase
VAPDLAKALEAARPTAVFLPMGLANPDHVLTHDAGLMARQALPAGEAGEAGTPAPTWFCYEDAGYKHLPGLLAWRVAKLFRGGLWPTPAVVPVRPDMEAKRTAIWLYASQIGPLERDHLLSERLAANTPEQYWRLEPPPPGWERLSSADVLDARPQD